MCGEMDGRTDRYAKSIGALRDLRQQKLYIYEVAKINQRSLYSL
jgi:hypothetical protein